MTKLFKLFRNSKYFSTKFKNYFPIYEMLFSKYFKKNIVFVEVETEGEELDAEEVFGTIEAVKTVSDLFLPVAGEIVEFNQGLEDDPSLINNDPFGEGWIIKVKVSDTADVEALMDADAYAASLG